LSQKFLKKFPRNLKIYSPCLPAGRERAFSGSPSKKAFNRSFFVGKIKKAGEN
jgi:hypothetical protein